MAGTARHGGQLEQEDHSRAEPAPLPVPAPNPVPATSDIAALHFAALQAHVAERAARQHRDYTSSAELPFAFRRAIAAAQAVSFDIFDTALIRYVDHPADVFLHLQQHPAFAAHSFHMPVARLRGQAETTARGMVYKLIASYEVNLLEIYQVFCDLAGVPRDAAPGFVAAEEQVELALCAPNPALHVLCSEAAAAGKQVLFVSDTYHTEEFLVRLLRSCGYGASPATVFASSFARKSKQSGELFPLVLGALAIEPASVVHLGDHPISDHQRAREAGITPILHPHKACRDEQTLTPPQHSDPASYAARNAALAAHSFMRGMVQATPQAATLAGRDDDFWWKLGYSAAGPLSTGFCQWLAQSLRRDGIEHAWFMLRDGALLYRVYQALHDGDSAACPVSTLPTSRRSALLPVLEIAPAFALPSLLCGIGLRPVREYLERLAIPASDFLPEAELSGFSSLDQQIDGRFEMNRLIRMLLQPRVMQAMRARSRSERRNLEAFLAQEGVTLPGKIALVDLGWGGTVQKSLHILLSQVAPSTQNIGYYVATFPEAPHSVIPGLEVRSYLAHRGEPREVYQHIHQFPNFFEIVYSSTEGSVLYFESEQSAAPGQGEQGKEAQPGGTIIPVRQPSDKSAAQCRHLDAMHEGAVAFARDYRQRSAPLRLPPVSPEAAAECFFRVILQPTPEEARRLGETVYCDNLGSASQHVSARLDPGLDPATLLAAYEQAHWKQGLLAMASPETASLRTLLWLISIAAPEGVS